MHCIIAVLLRAAWWSSLTDYLVITSPDNDSHYGVYKPSIKGQFPMPDDDSGIFMSVNRVAWPGTYNAYYCSTLLKPSDMINEITIRLIHVKEPENSIFGIKKKTFADCYKSIYKLNKERPSSDPLKMSNVMHKTACTEKTIGFLGTTNVISLIGEYNTFSSPRPDSSIVIEADKPVPMGKLIMRGHFFPRPGIYRWRAMAWYQGHLRLFEKCADKDVWYLLNQIGDEESSGDNIHHFLSAVNLEGGKPTMLVKKSEIRRRPWGNAVPRISKAKIAAAQAKDMAHYHRMNIIRGRLRASKPWGFLGAKSHCQEQHPLERLTHAKDRRRTKKSSRVKNDGAKQ